MYEALLEAHRILGVAAGACYGDSAVPYQVYGIVAHAKTYIGAQVEQYLRGQEETA